MMSEAHAKLARILRTKPEVFLGLSADALDRVSEENNVRVGEVLHEYGLSRDSTAEEVTHALTQKLMLADQHLKVLLHDRLLEQAQELAGRPEGFFIKKEKALELLKTFLPGESIDEANLTPTLCSLRFTRDTAWMHKFFDEAYGTLTADDFETRPVELTILDPHWLEVAKRFTKHKLHNVSHLKEFGIIFVNPEPTDPPGETLRTFMLLLHYLNEVPYYSRLFQRFSHDADFISKLQSLLRGDVSSEKL
ncbi:hypothetical protein EPO05_06740, partial [Patescibacteria group bacterium]